MYKNYFITFLIYLFAGFIAFGQDVQISYSEKTEADIPTQLSMKIDNKTYLKIDILADLSSKKTAVLNFYKTHNGVVTKFDMGIPVQLSGIKLNKEDNIIIEVMMKQQQDSVMLAFAVDGRVRDIMLPRNY